MLSIKIKDLQQYQSHILDVIVMVSKLSCKLNRCNAIEKYQNALDNQEMLSKNYKSSSKTKSNSKPTL